MKYLIALFAVTIALTLCVISCDADDDDDDDTADDDDQDDDDTSDDDDDDDQDRELVLDDGSAEDCIDPGSDGGLVGNIFDPSGSATLVAVKLTWYWCLPDPPNEQPEIPPPMNVYVFHASPETGPVGAAVFAQEVVPETWEQWETYELELPVAVGELEDAPGFVVAVGRADSDEMNCIAEDESADPTPEWGFYDGSWHKPSRPGAWMIRAIIRQ